MKTIAENAAAHNSRRPYMKAGPSAQPMDDEHIASDQHTASLFQLEAV